MSGQPVHEQEQFATNHVIIAPDETSALLPHLSSEDTCYVQSYNHGASNPAGYSQQWAGFGLFRRCCQQPSQTPMILADTTGRMTRQA